MTCPGAIPLKTTGISTGVTIKREARKKVAKSAAENRGMRGVKPLK